MTYAIALAVISAAVMILERVFPWRPQRQLRRTFPSDLLYLIFNGHFLGVILYGIAARSVLPWLDPARVLTYRDVAASWPLAIQIPVALVAIDFVHWCVHNLLHRIPLLWELHKTHHSVVDGEMDWIVSFRFQWTEVVIYKTVQYLPLAFFGFAPAAMLVHAVFGTLIGHLNHANLDLDWGPLKYVLNSPRMHLWHHDREPEANRAVNFGIIFSAWDWIFGTARLPAGTPEHIGFSGDETFPKNFFSQTAWPLGRLFAQPWLTAPAGAALIAAGWWLANG